MENKTILQDNEFFQKAISLYRKKNYDYAIELFSQLLVENPDFHDCQRYLWDSIRKKNETIRQPLISMLIQKVKIFLLSIKFSVLNLNKNNSQALELIKNIVLIDPNNISALFKLSDFYIQNKQNDSAITALEEIISIDKNNLSALKKSADIYYTRKSYEKAKIMAIKILELSPHYLPAENILNDISALGTIEKGFDEMKPAT